MIKFIVSIMISFALIALSAFAILNTMVSLKYEVDEPGDCLSRTSGQDLCLTIDIILGLIGLFVVVIIYSAYKLVRMQRNRISSDNQL